MAPLTAKFESTSRNADWVSGTTGEAEIVRSRAHRLFLIFLSLALSLFHLARACVFTPDNALVILLTFRCTPNSNLPASHLSGRLR